MSSLKKFLSGYHLPDERVCCCWPVCADCSNVGQARAADTVVGEVKERSRHAEFRERNMAREVISID